jgi:alcohol dehydrogenase, propanol-preferring
MKAMVLKQNAPIQRSPLKLSELPCPEPGPHEVRVKVRCCAICRTDLHVIEGDLPKHKLPVIPGHQVVGVVDRRGPSANKFDVGARVGIAWLRKTCGVCSHCRAGRENLCELAEFTGYHAHGGFAEYAIIHEDYAYEIPAAFNDYQPTPLLCAGIIGYRALNRAQLPKGGKLGIYGFGSSAHIVIQLARHRGSDVYVITRGEKHRALAEEMGAKWVGGPSDKFPQKFDSAIIFAPAGELVLAALESLDKGGTLSLAGIYMSPIPQLDYDRHLFYEKNIHSVTANTRLDGIGLLKEAGEISLRPRITKFRLEEANEALQALKNDAIQGTGVLMIGREA